MRADYAQGYRTLWERHWWWRAREALVLGWIERLHRRSPRGRILDVGCGDGLFFERLERFGQVEGLEADAALVHDPRIRVGTLGPDFRPAEPFDLILMLDVLEHIADDRAALASVWSALRPGGHLLLTVPALSWLWSRHDEVNEHYRRYDRRGIRAVLDAAGFAIEDARYFYAWTVAPLVARRWLASADYAVSIPPGPINRALTALSRAEHALGRVVRWPLGSSLLAVARKGAEPHAP